MLICTDGYFYNGKFHDFLNKINPIIKKIRSIKHVVLTNRYELPNIKLDKKVIFLEKFTLIIVLKKLISKGMILIILYIFYLPQAQLESQNV